MKDENTNYLLDYRTGGEIGPMKIICINFAVAEGEDYDRTLDWLRRKLMENDRKFTLGDYGPFKDEPVPTPEPEEFIRLPPANHEEDGATRWFIDQTICLAAAIVS